MTKPKSKPASSAVLEAEKFSGEVVDPEELVDDPDEIEDETVAESVPDFSDLGDAAAQSRITQALRGLTIDQLDEYFRRRGFAIVSKEDDEPEEDEDEIERFWAQVDGLPEDAHGYARLIVHRTHPLHFQGFVTKGYCSTYPLPCSIEDIKERLGGGTYRLMLKVDANERANTNVAYCRSAIITIVDPPYPKIGMLSKDEKAQGLTLAPDVEGRMERIDEKLKDLADGGKQKQSSMDKAMEAFMVTSMKRLADPPPPPPPPEIPTPLTPEEQIQSSIGLVTAIQKLGKALTSDDDAGVDPEDDSFTGKAARTVTNIKTMMSGIGEAMRDMRAHNTRGAAVDGRQEAPAQPAEIAMTPEERLDAVSKINEAITILMRMIMDTDTRAKGIAAEINKKLSEIPTRFHKTVQAQLTDEQVFSWIEDWINDNQDLDADGKQKCVDKINGRNGKAKIQKILKILRGEEE